MDSAAVKSRPPVALDGSIWMLVAVNVAALAIAQWKHWPLNQLMLLYWAQSIAIGLSYVMRILSLEKFSTEGFKVNDRAVDPTRETKLRVALFFVVHFGMFHVVYFMFLVGKGGPQLDRRGMPNIGTLMFTPYVRIVPMHLTILTGGLFGKGLLLFGTLKVLADIGMHLIEHAQLQKARQAI